MKTAIIFYSRSGNTKYAAELLKSKLKEKNHDADIIEIEAVKRLGFFGAGRAGMKEIEVPIKNTEVDLKNYTTIILGAPVWGGKPSPVLKTFINSAKNIKGKKAALFITGGGKAESHEKVQEVMRTWMQPMEVQVCDAFCDLQMSKGKIKSGEELIDSYIQSVLSL